MKKHGKFICLCRVLSKQDTLYKSVQELGKDFDHTVIDPLMAQYQQDRDTFMVHGRRLA